MEFGIYAACVIVAYLLGSIPTGYWLGRLRGIDIRTVGSGNIGATNTFRVLGKTAGTFALAVDILKGFVAVLPLPLLAQQLVKCDHPQFVLLQITCSIAVIAGHNWTLFLKFKGGKGVATSAGAMLALATASLLAALAVWIVVFLMGRFVSLASILAAVVIVIFTWLWPTYSELLALKIFVTVMALAIIWKHRSNIQRLATGTENRVNFRKRTDQ